MRYTRYKTGAVTDGVLGPILDGSLKGLLASANIYSKPPVDLAAYGNLINEYTSGGA